MPGRRQIPRMFFTPVAALAAIMGFAYLLGDPERTASPSFGFARAVAGVVGMGMQLWGVVFLIGSLVLTVAIGTGSRRLLEVALFVGGGLFTWWACCFALSAVGDPHASLTGWAIHGFIAATLFLSSYLVRAGFVA